MSTTVAGEMRRDPGKRPWRRLLWIVPAALVLLAVAILVARWLRADPVTASFFDVYPGDGTILPGAPEGFPWWLSWAHFLNAFLLLFIVRSGLLIRGKQRPPAFVTRRNTRLKTQQRPTRLSLHVWWHLVVDSLWALSGIVYVILLFATGHWMRLVPASWDVIPNAVSAGLQYLSLDWPTHRGWAHYNALQLLMYGFTVFVAAPLAIVSGLRLSPVWRPSWRVNGLFTEKRARGLHFAVMWYFIGFTVVHVALVFATGARGNLNAMYAGVDDAGSWAGALVFAGSVVVMAVGWVLLRPPAQTRLAELARTDVRRMPAPPPAPKKST